jgi:hypothetical protein
VQGIRLLLNVSVECMTTTIRELLARAPPHTHHRTRTVSRVLTKDGGNLARISGVKRSGRDLTTMVMVEGRLSEAGVLPAGSDITGGTYLEFVVGEGEQ